MNGGIWTRETVAMLLLACFLPMASSWVWYGGHLSLAFLVLMIVYGWQLLFLLARAQAPSLSGVITALAVAMLSPEQLGPLRLALGVSFGVVMGELVFGGWGRNVVNPATVSLAFLGFGFPSFEWPAFDVPVAWAAIPAVALGCGLGVMSVGLALGASFVAIAASLLGAIDGSVVIAAAIVFVLLVADPATAATTRSGAWAQGGLFVALLTLFHQAWTGAAPVQMAVAASLLTSLAVPLLDEAALAAWVALRRRRHGRT
ncbi:MAG: RnfABCDGE type electron transport complex subunit D [Pseudomonadota bacterium]|nr:RnfABCDGE type electron transport complex subunit D [Pseudomonadota bacterium]